MTLFYSGFVGWIICIGLDIYRNYWMISKKGITPNYWGHFLYRSFFGFICFVMMNPEFDPFTDLNTVWQGRWIAGYQVSSFYLLFDPILNKLLNRVWSYKGKNSGWLDKLKMAQYYALKLVCVLLLIISLFIIFHV